MQASVCLLAHLFTGCPCPTPLAGPCHGAGQKGSHSRHVHVQGESVGCRHTHTTRISGLHVIFLDVYRLVFCTKGLNSDVFEDALIASDLYLETHGRPGEMDDV